MKTQSHLCSRKYISISMLFYCVLSTGLLLTLLDTAAATEKTDKTVLHSGLIDHITSLAAIPSEDQQALLGADGIQFEDQVVVVTFFASWCPPCLDEFEVLNSVSRQLDNKSIVFVALNVFEEFDDQDDVRMTRFLQRTQPEFPVLKGTETSIELFGGINRIPTLFVFDKSGKMAFNFVHKRGAAKQSVDAVELLEAIRPLL